MSHAIITVADLPGEGELLVPFDAVLTPLARDEAERRGLKVKEVAAVEAGKAARERVGSEKRVALGADHAGFQLKEQLKPLLEQLGLVAEDLGVHEEKPAEVAAKGASLDVTDYPDIAALVAEAVASGRAARGILVDGAGIGSAIAANKVPGVRAALCYDKASARNSREHNNANVLTLGSRLLPAEVALEVAATWLTTPFAGGRHEKRVAKITEIERRYRR